MIEKQRDGALLLNLRNFRESKSGKKGAHEAEKKHWKKSAENGGGGGEEIRVRKWSQ